MYGIADLDNCYVSCERVFRPDLTGVPVVVLSNNDGCVVARSNELKALGIPMGTPLFQLRPLLSRYHIAICSSNYELYADISRRVMAILAEESPCLEQYSIDEAFMRLNLERREGLPAFGGELRRRIRQWTGIPVSVGFGPSKTLAKAATHIAKKRSDGVFLMPEKPLETLDGLPVEEVWGVGSRLAVRLRQRGIATAGQLARADEVKLAAKYSVCLARTVLELRGQSVLELEDVEQRQPQTLACTRAFGAVIVELRELREAVATYLDQAAERLRAQNQVAGGLIVFLQAAGANGGGPETWNNASRTLLLETPTASNAELLKIVLPEVDRLFVEGTRYRKAGVVFFALEDAAQKQLMLFEPPVRPRQRELYSAMDSIKRQYGRRALFNLAEGISQNWRMRREHLTPCYTTRWKDLLMVN